MLHNVSNRSFLLSVIFMLGLGRVFSQVNIKERVEIKPRPVVQATTTQEVVLFADDPNPGGPAHVLVLHPCFVTATATIEMQGNPSSDLYVKTLVGGSIAWYNGHNISPPQNGSNPVTFPVRCGSIPIRMESTWEGIDIRSTTKTIGSNNASFVFQGMLSRCSYTVRVQFQATIDESYDLASMELSTDATELTQCQNTTGIHWKLYNANGDVYQAVSCDGNPPPTYLEVESLSNVRLVDYWGRSTKRIDIPLGYEDALLNWYYNGELENSVVTVTLCAAGRSMSKQITLNVDDNVTGIQYQRVPWFVVHLLKSTLTVTGTVCNGRATGPLSTGATVNLEVTQGMDLGYLRDPETGQRGVSLSSVKAKEGKVKFEYWAQGRDPNMWESVTIRATSQYGDAECAVNVVESALRATFEPPEAAFGDTAKLSIECRDLQGNFVQVPPEWKTFYEIIDGAAFGQLRSMDGSVESSPLIGNYPQAKIRTFNITSPPDSAAILIRVIAVRPWDGGEDGPMAKTTGGSTSQSKLAKSRMVAGIKSIPHAGTRNVTSDPDPEEYPDLGSGIYYFGAAQLVVKNKESCIQISFATSPISMEDTTLLRFKRMNSDGSLEDVPANEPMDVMIVTSGEDVGLLLSASGGTGVQLLNVTQPIRYIAPSSVEGESLPVSIIAATKDLSVSGTNNIGKENISQRMTNDGKVGASASKTLEGSKNGSDSAGKKSSPLQLSNPLKAALLDLKCAGIAGEAEWILSSIEVKASSPEIKCTEMTTLKAELLDDEELIPSSGSSAKIGFFIGSEGEAYVSIAAGGTSKGQTITDVPYSEAMSTGVKFIADGLAYDGRFPLGIGVGASVNGPIYLEDHDVIYLIGTNTKGKILYQNNTHWADSIYDGGTNVIGNSGCALSCAAMILRAYGMEVDPLSLNRWMQEKNKFQNGDVLWGTLAVYPGSPIFPGDQTGDGLSKDPVTRKTNIIPKTLPSLQKLDEAISAGKPVIAQVLNPTSNNGHFVIVTVKTQGGDYTIIDPAGYQTPRVTLGGVYKTIYKYIPIEPYQPKR